MALSSIVRKTCSECGKIALEIHRIEIGPGKKMITLGCGHFMFEDALSAQQDIATILNGCKLMDYQVEGVKWMLEANGLCLLADEQGLGKTIQVLALFKLCEEQLLPAVVCAPTTVKLQWMHEIMTKCGIKHVQVIGSSKELAAPGMKIYVTTYDLLKNENTFSLINDNIKTIVIDECQRIKDHLSGRAKAVQKIAKNCEHIIALSGTPIKNNAGEYYTVLNLIQPRMFPYYNTFVQQECDHYETPYGFKIGGLKNPTAFHEKTKDFILRRVKKDVLQDLPDLSRNFFHVELDRRLNKAYNDLLGELDDILYDDELGGMERSNKTLAVMTKLRQITGISKVEQCVDFVTEFLLSNDRKIVVFAHHHAVVDKLEADLNAWLQDGGWGKVLNMNSTLSADARQEMTEKFRDDPSRRVMIASTLAAGEGLNLQFCSDAVMLERQWNPANEEQAEGRFHRYGQKNPVTVTYMLATETIDEYFSELVEQKRAYMMSTLDNQEMQWDQASLVTELSKILVAKGKKPWKL